MDDVLQPKRSNLENIWVYCRDLVKCRCSEGCTSRVVKVSCRNAQLNCTLLCDCQGECSDSLE